MSQLPKPIRSNRLATIDFGDDAFADESGFSTTGNKTLILTEEPGIHVNDEGGFISSAVLKSVKGEELRHRCQYHWVDRGQSFRFQVQFDDTYSATFETSNDKLCEAAETVFQSVASSSSAGFHYEIPIGISAVFVQPVDERRDNWISKNRKEGPLVSTVLSDKFDASFFLEVRNFLPDITERACYDLIATREAYLTVRIENGRCILGNSDGETVTTILIGQGSWSRDGSTVEVEGNLLLAGWDAKKIQLHFPRPALAEEAEKAIREAATHATGDGDTEQARSASPGTVRGALNGDPDARYDVDLYVEGDGRLTLKEPGTSSIIAAFDFEDPQTLIQGKPESFLVQGDGVGPLEVRAASDQFQKRLLEAEDLQAAAERTARSRCFIGWDEDDAPISVVVGEETLKAASANVRLECSLDDLQQIEPGFAEGETLTTLNVTLREAAFQVRAQPKIVENLSQHLRSHVVAENAEGRFAELCTGLLPLERDYMLYTALHPLVDFHHALETTADLGTSDPLHLKHPEGEQLHQVLYLFSASIEDLLRHVDYILHYFPAHILNQDIELFRSVGQKLPSRLDDTERVYVNACSAIRPLQNRLREIERHLFRLKNVRQKIAKSKPGGKEALEAGLLGLAAVVNPIFLVGGAQRVYSQWKSEQRGDEMLDESSEEVAHLVVKTWNRLMGVLLPSVVHRMQERAYEGRVLVGRTLAKRHEAVSSEEKSKMLHALADRFAKLESFKAFPPAAQAAQPRSSAIDLLHQTQKREPAIDFAMF